MAKIQIPDGGGASLNLLQVDDDYCIPDFELPNPMDMFKSMLEWKIRDDDVMLIAYPKSGTHWLWEMMSMMVAKDDQYKPSKVVAMIEALREDQFDNLSSPRVLNSHILPKYLPKEYFKKKTKTVLVLRNPKDVAVSFYNHSFSLTTYGYNGEFKNYLRIFLEGKVDYGGIFRYMNEWQKYMEDHPDHPILITYYENLIKDCSGELMKIRDFLNLDVDNSLIQGISDRCTFSTLKEEKVKNINKKFLKYWKNQEPKMFRKGKIGDWKNWLTVAENEIFDRYIAENMKNSIFKFQYD